MAFARVSPMKHSVGFISPPLQLTLICRDVKTGRRVNAVSPEMPVIVFLSKSFDELVKWIVI